MLAEGELKHVGNLIRAFYRTPLTAIMEDLLILRTWCWYRNAPTTQLLLQLHSQHRIYRYLRQRDKYRKDADEHAEAR